MNNVFITESLKVALLNEDRAENMWRRGFRQKSG